MRADRQFKAEYVIKERGKKFRHTFRFGSNKKVRQAINKTKLPAGTNERRKSRFLGSNGFFQRPLFRKRAADNFFFDFRSKIHITFSF